jgi:hypothetical protein
MSTGLLQAPTNATESSNSRDCRVYPRHACQVSTLCQPAGGNETRWPAAMNNVSQGGVALVLGRRFERKTCLAIELPGANDGDPYTVFVRVVHLRSNGDGSYTLGCQFVSELSEEELGRLVHEQPPSTPTSDVPSVVADLRVEVEESEAVIARCRVKRFHVASSWPLEAGQTIYLRGIPVHGRRDGREYRVVGCDEDASGRRLRLQLV